MLLPWDVDVDEATLTVLLTTHLPQLGAQARKWIMDALAVAAYHAQTIYPVVQLLVCDDAPQWAWLTEAIGGCWVHEGRHYKKLTPWVAAHQQALDAFLHEFWSFYDDLLAYREQPTDAERVRLVAAFDSLVATTTDYWALNERIAKTRARKTVLLAVLEHPEIPLHNNAAELAARQRVRKRDVSFGPRTIDPGVGYVPVAGGYHAQIGDQFLSLHPDRIRGDDQIPPLAEVIAERAEEWNLGASWAPASEHPAFLS